MSRNGNRIGPQINLQRAHQLPLGLFCLLLASIPLSAVSQSVSITWDSSTETNLAGYIVRYGLVSGQYSISNDVGRVTSATVSGLQEGSDYFFVVTAYDTSRLESDPSSEVSYQVPISANVPPTLNPLGNLALLEDAGPQTVALSGITSGAPDENQTLTINATSSSPTLIPHPVITYASPNPTASLTFAPLASASGTATITVTINDGQANNSLITRSFDVSVAAVNDAPAISAIASQQTAANTPSQFIPFTIQDPDSSGSSLSLSATSSDSTLVPVSGIVFGGNGPNRTVQLTPAAGQTGQAGITIAVTDGLLAATTTFLITVSPLSNSPPTLNPSGNLALLEDAGPQAVALSGITSGAPNENQALTVTATSSNPTLIPHPVITYASPQATAMLRFTPLTNASGTATITVTVNDGQANNSLITRSFDVSVAAVNDATPPVISAISGQLTAEDTLKLVPFTVSGGTNPGDVTLIATSSDAALVPLANIVLTGSAPNYTAHITPQSNLSGNAIITIVASHGTLSASRSFLLTVTAANDPPTLNPAGNLALLEDAGPQAVALSGITSGAPNEAEALTLTATSSNPTLIPHPVITYASPQATATLRFTPLTNANGTATITVTVNDGQANNNLFTRSFDVSVAAVNDATPPVISAISGQLTAEDTLKLVPFTVSGGTNPGDVSLTATSSDTTLVPLANIVLTGSAPNYTARITPQSNLSGNTTITIVASHGTLSASRSFVLIVSSANDAPTLNPAGNLALLEDAGAQTVALSGITSGAPSENQALTITATSSNPTLIPHPVITYASPNATATLRFTPLTDANGTATITVTVNDGQANNNLFTRSFDVSVAAVNDATPPVISAISGQFTAEDTLKLVPFTVSGGTNPGDVSLTATSSDTTLVPLANIVLTGSAPNYTARITPQSNLSGNTTITIVASHGTLSASRSFVLTVTAANDPPTLNPAGNLALLEDAGAQTVALSGITSGAPSENQALTVTATSSNPTLIPNPVITYASPQATATLRFTPLTNASGTATITVTVNDGQANNHLITRSFDVSVAALNDAPTISAIASQQTDEDVPLTAPFVIGDRDTTSLNLWATSTNTVLVPLAGIFFDGIGNNRTITLVPARNRSGTTFITAYVSDGVATNSASFVLTVNPVNDFPTLNVIPNFGTVSANNGVHIVPINGLSSGATNESQTLVVTAVSSNPSLLPNPFVSYNGTATNGTLTLRPGNGRQGNATITVTVTDSGTPNSAFVRTFQVNISAPANAGPTMSIFPNLTTSEDTALGPLAFTVGDPTTAAASLTLRADSSNPTLLPIHNIIFGGSGANRTLTLIPALNQSGVASVYLTVIDSAFGSSNQMFTFTVNAANDPPAITGLAAQTVAKDNALGPLAFNVTDPETPSDNLIVTAASGNQTLVPNANIVLAGSGANRTVRLTPAAGQTGQASIILSVTDGVRSANTTFLLTVTPPSNSPPVISAISGQDTDDMTPLEALPFTVRDAETPAQILAVFASSSNPSLLPATNIVLGGSGSNRTVTVLPISGQAGTATVSVAVSDGAATVTTSFRLSVRLASPALLVNIQGDGAVLPNLSGRALARGRSYSVTARPHPGQIFAGWSGGVTSSAPLLRFTMGSNLVLIANFMTNPFTPIRGTYTGLFYEADEVRHERSGFFRILTTPQGTYTGTLGLGSRTHPVSGRMDTGRRGTNTIRRTGATALHLEFQLGTESTLDQATGRVTDGNWVAALTGDRSTFHTATNPTPFAGKYTAIIPGNTDSSESPGGDGFGRVTIAPGGSALLTGLTGDRQPLIRATPLSKQGEWPLYIPLYGGKGSILGWINVMNRPSDDMTGQLSWIRPGIRAAKYYKGGFTNETFLVGSSYLAPATRTNRVIELTNALVTFSGGNLPESITNRATLSANNRLINTSSNKMVATLAVSSGLFSGSVVNPATGKSLAFRGALLQKRNAGSGFFFGTNETGRVELHR